MNILLVNPPAISVYHKVGLRLAPLGVAYVAGVLREHNHQVKIIDLNVERIDYKTYPYENFDLVGISVDTTRYPVSLDIAKSVKHKGVRVVMGGSHVTFTDEEVLSTNVVDYVVRGEGEYTMLDLIEHLQNKFPLDDIFGISYRSNGEIRRNQNRVLVSDLDTVPFPARDLLPLNLYNTTLTKRFQATMLTSRGCPYNCDFCSCSLFSGTKWRTRSVENILEEIELLYHKYGFRAVSFLDDNFTLSPERVAKICKRMIKKNWDLFWWAFSRVDTIVKNESMIKLMSEAGLKQLFVGFESGSQEVLDQLGKNLVVENAFKAMEILRKYKIQAWGSFMIGALNETKQMIKQTIRFANRLNLYASQFSILTPYPGTRLYEVVKNRLLTKNWEDFWGGKPVIRLDKLTPPQLKRLMINAHLSFYIRPKRLIEVGLPFLYEYLWGYKKAKKVPLKKVNGDWVPVPL